MKQILYVCTKPVSDWEIFLPQEQRKSRHHNISVLSVDCEQNVDHSALCQFMFIGKKKDEILKIGVYRNIVYQDFLNEVFSHDLCVVL